MSMLDPSHGDLSIKLLSTVIGPGWQNLFISGGAGAHLTLLGQMFGIFNLVVLSGLIAMYSVIVAGGIISTAHSGQVLGHRMSSAWVPIRAAGSVGLLTPLPFAKGFCLLQALVLMFTSYGIGMADHIWAPAVHYLAADRGAIEGPRPTAAWTAADGVLRALIERAYFIQHRALVTQQQYRIAEAAQGWRWMPAADTGGAGAYELEFPAPDLGLVTDFGTITVPCAGAAPDPLCRGKATAMTQLIDRLTPVANAIVSHFAGGANTTPPGPAYIQQLLQDYARSVEAAVPAYIAQTQGQLSSALQNFAAQASDEGWASAGMYYESVAAENDRMHRAVALAPVVTAAPTAEYAGVLTWGGLLPAYLAQGEQLMRAANPGMDERYDESLALTTSAPAPHESLNWVERKISAIFNFGVSHIETALTQPTGDPLARLQADGNTLDDDVGMIWTATALTHIVGVHLPTNLHFAALAVLAAGADMAVYLPALPFILFTLATIGWGVLVLESLVAAPLWAAAHGMPEGEGFAGESGRQGYMLFLGVILRPALMILGYFIAIGLFDGSAWLIGQGWRVFSAAAGQGYVLGPVNAAATIVVLVVLITLAAHQCFGLITWLPAHVTGWIGQRGEQLGESAGASEVRGGVRRAGSQVGDAGKHTQSPGGAAKPKGQGQGGGNAPPAGDRGPSGSGGGA